jgi:hypothetical protein
LGLATSLLLDAGYFGFDRGDCLHGQLWWLREYDVDLGPPCGAYEKDRYAPGTYSRQFAGGTVVVNPTDSDVNVSVPEELMDATTGISGRAFAVPALDGRLFLGGGRE